MEIIEINITKDLIGSSLLISKSYCKSPINEVDVLDIQESFIKLQSPVNPVPGWERISDIKVELILKKEAYENKGETT